MGTANRITTQQGNEEIQGQPRTLETPDQVATIPRVVVVGTGFVGSTTAYTLMMSGLAGEIILIDRDPRRAEGHVNDLRDAEVFSHTTRVSVGEFSDCCSADVTIITAGVSQSGQKSRTEGLRETGAILHGLVSDVCLQNPRGILLIASNPVDVLTYAAWKWSGLAAHRVIGSGTCLDTSRLRRRLAKHYSVASDNVHAYVIGEHGDSQIPVLSSARVAGLPLDELSNKLGMPDAEISLERIVDETRTAGNDIIEAKGATYYGIGAALVRIIRAILRDEQAILTTSSRVPKSMHLGEVSLSLPSIIDRQGVARVLPVALNRSERVALEASAHEVKRGIGALSHMVPI